MGQLTAPVTTQIGTTITGGTPGSVLFVGAGPVIAQDNANFFWNDTTNQLLLGDGNVANPAYSFANDTDTGIFFLSANQWAAASGGSQQFGIAVNGGLAIISTGFLEWSSTSSIAGSPDVRLTRDAANILAQRNGTNAQAFRLYNTFTNAGNYEYGALFWSGNILALGTDQLGTGSARVLRFSTGGGYRWEISTAGHLLGVTDNIYDIGASGATRPQSIYVGTSIQIEANNGLRLTNQTDGAAAAAGTLLNAPTAGDPAFWLPVTINGNTRYIPAWA